MTHLSEPVRPVDGLPVVHRVPVEVVQHHRVRRGQVQPEPTGPRRQKEDREGLVARRVELVDQPLALADGGLAVEPEVRHRDVLEHHLQGSENTQGKAVKCTEWQ